MFQNITSTTQIEVTSILIKPQMGKIFLEEITMSEIGPNRTRRLPIKICILAILLLFGKLSAQEIPAPAKDKRKMHCLLT